MNKIKVKKHLDIMAIDNYFVIDGAMIIDKDYILLDDLLLDKILRESTGARWDNTFKQVFECEKPTNWSGVLPTQPKADYIPMLATDCYTKINKVTYRYLRCHTEDRIELQAINDEWLEKYLPHLDIYYSPSSGQFTQWKDNQLVAVIMPAMIKRTYLYEVVESLNTANKTIGE